MICYHVQCGIQTIDSDYNNPLSFSSTLCVIFFVGSPVYINGEAHPLQAMQAQRDLGE
jgi:hypothetical protein